MKSRAIKVFIHIPKTAGSTVNAYLERSGELGASHVEAWIENDATKTHSRGILSNTPAAKKMRVFG